VTPYYKKKLQTSTVAAETVNNLLLRRSYDDAKKFSTQNSGGCTCTLLHLPAGAHAHWFVRYFHAYIISNLVCIDSDIFFKRSKRQ